MHAANGGGRPAGMTPVQGCMTRPSRSLVSNAFRLGSHESEHIGWPAFNVRLYEPAELAPYLNGRNYSNDAATTYESTGRPLSVSHTTTRPVMSPLAR